MDNYFAFTCSYYYYVTRVLQTTLRCYRPRSSFFKFVLRKGNDYETDRRVFSRPDCHQVSVKSSNSRKRNFCVAYPFYSKNQNKKTFGYEISLKNVLTKIHWQIRTFSNRIQLFKKKQKDRFAVDSIIIREYELERQNQMETFDPVRE